jgi:HTH-type transcriptional regulator, sugar sensing transcriptional regulator
MHLEQLKELGLSEGQIGVYSACLELGIASLNQLHEKTGIERRNIYDILNKLIEKGLISYIEEKGKRTYQCTHPNKIREEAEAKQQALQQLLNILPQITAQYNEAKPSIKAEVYRGDDAMKALMNEALEYKEIYFIGGNSGVENAAGLKFWFKHWMEQRVEKRIMLYDLVDHGTFLEGLPPSDIKIHKKHYYKYCQLPKDLSSPMVILIFGNKVAQILWSKQSFAFVLESREITESFMKYFHYFWKDPW